MSRRYCDPIPVWFDRPGTDGVGSDAASGRPVAEQVSAAVPARFRWHRSLYVVTDVLGHWIEAGPWWSDATAAVRAPAVRAVRAGSVGVDAPRSPRSSPGGITAPAQRRVWRVEAAGRGGSGVFDLCEPRGEEHPMWLLLAAVD